MRRLGNTLFAQMSQGGQKQPLILNLPSTYMHVRARRHVNSAQVPPSHASPTPKRPNFLRMSHPRRSNAIPNASLRKPIYPLVVKSVSRLDEPLFWLRLQLQASAVSCQIGSSTHVHIACLPSARFPQAQVDSGSLFSVAAFSQAACMSALAGVRSI